MNTFKAYALFVPELKQLIRDKNVTELKSVLRGTNPVDLAEGWSAFTSEDQTLVFKLLDSRRAVVVFEELDVEQQMFLLSTLDQDVTLQFVEDIGADKAAHLFRKLPRRTVKRMALLVKKEEEAKILHDSSSYPPKTAGALMHTGLIALKKDMKVSQALELISTLSRVRAHEEGTLGVLYVVDIHRHLLGSVSLQELVAAPRDSIVSELMKPTQFIKMRVQMDQEEAANVFTRYSLVSAPVVNEQDHLVGVLLVDDILDVVQAEATEDIAKMVGASSQVITSGSLLRLPVWRLSWLRSPWLVVTLVGQCVVSLIIKHFEPVLSQTVALASFMPSIAALGGNVGSQSGTIVVRGLATGELEFVDVARTVFGECRVGAIIGIVFGLLVGGVAFGLYGMQFGYAFPFVVGCSVLISMVLAASMGGFWPFILLRFGYDPATATGPLITTVTDLLSILAFFTMATVLLS